MRGAGVRDEGRGKGGTRNETVTEGKMVRDARCVQSAHCKLNKPNNSVQVNSHPAPEGPNIIGLRMSPFNKAPEGRNNSRL